MPSPFRLTFHGAAGEVTGSCTLVEAAGRRILVDLGMIQGSPLDELRNAEPLPFDPATIDAVLVTHAHVDHCGRLPLLLKGGFQGVVLATPPTAELLGPVLRSSARLQQIRIFEHAARVGGGRGGLRHVRIVEPDIDDDPPPVILYTEREVDFLMERVASVQYGAAHDLFPGLQAVFHDAGHMIGSASIELRVRAGPGGAASGATLLFSGDLGPSSAPLLSPPQSPPGADLLVLESTYGGRRHPTVHDALAQLAKIIRQARRDRDRIIIPTFALGRAQQLLYRLGELSRDGRLLGTNVYLDSKMAIVGCEAYARHRDLLAPAAARAVREGDSPLQFPELHYILSRTDSKRLNHLRGGIVLAGSGFCHGGPIMHHLAHGLWRDDTRLILIGFQPKDSLAHALAHGARRVAVFDREIDVNATVHTMQGFSGHADEPDLLAWLGGMARRPKRILLNHGDPPARAALASKIREQFGTECETPALGSVHEP